MFWTAFRACETCQANGRTQDPETVAMEEIVYAGGQFCVVMEASGLHSENVHLSTAHDRMHAHVEIHMKQMSRLLKALGAQASDVVGGAQSLPQHSSFRIILPLPQAVVPVAQMSPLLLDGFFMWHLDIA